MVTKGEVRWGRTIVVLFLILFVVIGIWVYLYYSKHKEPTQGILVYQQEIRKELVSGYLY